MAKQVLEMNKYDDTEVIPLVERAIKGDKDALNELCQKILKGVFYRSSYGVNQRADAEDVSQNVMLKVCEKISELRNPKAFRGWLLKIIVSETNALRRNRYGNDADVDDFANVIIEENEDLLPDMFIETNELHEVIIKAIQRLSHRQRQVVLLHYYDDLSVNDIAEVMDLSQPTVSVHLMRAREAMKTELTKYLKSDSSGSVQSLNSIGAVPLSFLLTDALRCGTIDYALPNAQWIANTLAQCQEAIYFGVAAAATSVTAATITEGAYATSSASKTSMFSERVAAIIITVVSVCVIGVGVWFGITSDESPYYAQHAQIEGEIIFEGEENISESMTYVNPAFARAQIDTDSDYTILYWWIIRVGDDTVSYQGYGCDIGNVFALMRENGEQGEFMLYFRIECDLNIIYRLGGNFYLV